MNHPGRITSRHHLLQKMADLAPSRACKRAIDGGAVVNLGGFRSIPPLLLPGWVCSVRSVHGRTWLLALVVNEIKHSYSCHILDRVPWEEWDGGQGVFGGDNPEENSREHRKHTKGD